MKKKIIIIITIIILLSFIAIIIVNKNIVNNSKINQPINNDSINTIITDDSRDDEQNSNNNQNSREIKYKCNYDSGWNEFNPKEAFGYYLGKYRQTVIYTFSIIDNKYLSNTNYINKYEFENIDGYAYFTLQGDYDSVLDEENLTKTYSSTKFIVGNYSSDDTIDNYIKTIKSKNYTCDLNN